MSYAAGELEFGSLIVPSVCSIVGPKSYRDRPCKARIMNGTRFMHRTWLDDHAMQVIRLHVVIIESAFTVLQTR